FGPAHSPALLRRGASALAVMGVCAAESQAAIDAAASSAILWLDHCRQNSADRAYVEGALIVAPRGATEILQQRLTHLHRDAAHWRLFALDERDAEVREIDTTDTGNISTRLQRSPDEGAARERF